MRPDKLLSVSDSGTVSYSMHTSVRLHPDKFSLRFFGMNAGFAGFLLAILLVGCTKQELPELGPRLSQTAALELSPSLLEFKGEYTDNCGHLQIVDLGSQNGTKLKGAVLLAHKPMTVTIGDRLEFGNVTARLCDAGALYDTFK